MTLDKFGRHLNHQDNHASLYVAKNLTDLSYETFFQLRGTVEVQGGPVAIRNGNDKYTLIFPLKKGTVSSYKVQPNCKFIINSVQHIKLTGVTLKQGDVLVFTCNAARGTLFALDLVLKVPLFPS